VACLRTEDGAVRLCLLTASLVLSLTAGCAEKPALSMPSGDLPPFDPMAFFEGHTHSWGVIESRSGAPTESVVTDSHADIDATNRLHMAQHLAFQDGTMQQRDWVLWRSGPNQFEATANDMVGVAKGETDGRMFHWQWVLARSPGNPLMNVTMNQWMYRMQDGSVTIRSTVSKLGFIVAEVTEQFVRVEKG
jgi:hypothetical protein